MMMNDTNTDAFTYTLSDYQSQDGNTLNDACFVISSFATILWIANKLCDKWLFINHYDDEEDVEVHWNSLDQVEDDEEEQEDEGEDTEDDVERGQVADCMEDSV